ncbi:DUF2244 domain-containing protein [Palleronia sp. KMU-117]|uniref:DUF2244 domain-containing protein n=1 Tax=Palleronia sp. KMU-117 TaxID=3434108 RepID=UPI003D730558
MPLKWDDIPERAPAKAGARSHGAGADAPLARLSVWPHRSLPRQGFAIFIGVTFVLLLMPLLAVLGTPVLWGLLPFVMGVLALTWILIERSYSDARLTEVLTLWPDRLELVRTNPRGPVQRWEANPYWVRVELHKDGGPVENYLTLKGGDREVELGAFLSPEERTALHHDLQRLLARVGR